jgi:hypothetical protein
VSYRQCSWMSVWVVNGSLDKLVATMAYSLRNLDLGMTTTKRGILFFQRLINFDVRNRTCRGQCSFEFKSIHLLCRCSQGLAQRVGDLLSKGSSGSTAILIY